MLNGKESSRSLSLCARFSLGRSTRPLGTPFIILMRKYVPKPLVLMVLKGYLGVKNFKDYLVIQDHIS